MTETWMAADPAVTRGRRLVILVRDRKALAIAVKRVESRPRITTLRLTENMGGHSFQISGVWGGLILDQAVISRVGGGIRHSWQTGDRSDKTPLFSYFRRLKIKLL